jgi:NAD(P)H-hydrate epimerase
MQQGDDTVSLILTAEQMRMADAHTIRELGVSGEWLMEQAGAAVADAVRFFLEQERAHEPVVIVAGPGNNGGDGFAAAAHLIGFGIRVELLLLGSLEKLQGDAASHAASAVSEGLDVYELSDQAAYAMSRPRLQQAGMLVDTLFGTGLNRAPEGMAAELIATINDIRCPLLAVDVASGVDSDTGQVPGEAIRATWTLPIAACKWGHWQGEGRICAGEILPAADIGIPETLMQAMQAEYPGPAARARLITREDLRLAETPRRYDMHKKDFGHLWVFGGSRGYTGAPRLAALGAHAMDAGLVSIGCPDTVYSVLAPASLETMVHPQDSAPWQGADAVIAGPGWGRSQGGLLAELVASGLPLLLDADALNMVAEDGRLAGAVVSRKSVTVMTPHPGEAGRLLGCTSAAVQANRPAAARALAERFHAWIVLKGASTLIVSPGLQLWLCPFGSTALARGGTGDVLAGMIGALLARGLPAEAALPAAVGLHALAGEDRAWWLAGELPERVFALRRRLCERV